MRSLVMSLVGMLVTTGGPVAQELKDQDKAEWRIGDRNKDDKALDTDRVSEDCCRKYYHVRSYET